MIRDSYVILDSHGNMIGEQPNAQDAVKHATKMAAARGGHAWGDADQLKPDLVQNPAPQKVTPELAYYLTGLSEASRRDGGIPTGQAKGSAVYGFSRERVMEMSMADAQARLRPYLPAQRLNLKDKKPKGKGAWSTAAETADSLLQTNAKTAKTAIAAFERQLGRPIKASSTGLSLLPHFLPGRVTDIHGKPVLETANGKDGFFPPGVAMGPSFFVNDEPAMQEHYGPQGTGIPLTFCAKSSPMCRATCLAYSGQNQVSDEAVLSKHALTQAILREPRAFLRLLVESIRKRMSYFGRGERVSLKDIEALYEGDPAAIAAEVALADRYDKIPLETWIRLNVYQDIPWELFFPDLFASMPARGDKPGGWPGPLRVYDYTKVTGRPFLPNYNLTFSFSGDNLDECLNELRRGRNVAAVFVRTAEEKAVSERKQAWADQPLRQRHGKDLFYGITKHPFLDPATGRPLPVLNGDLHDIRAYDRAVLDSIGWHGPAVIGLDFKIPRIKVGHKRRGDAVVTKPLYKIEDAGTFVLRVKEIDGARLVATSGGALDRLGAIEELPQRYEVV
jgi:hypothetical protein